MLPRMGLSGLGFSIQLTHLMKLIKRALTSLGGTVGSLTWGELQTLFYQAPNLTNERPIDARAQEQEYSVEYLTPNTLLLGRAGIRGDSNGIDLYTHPWRRLRDIRISVHIFWKKLTCWTQPIYSPKINRLGNRGVLKSAILCGLQTKMPFGDSQALTDPGRVPRQKGTCLGCRCQDLHRPCCLAGSWPIQ